MDVCSRRLDLCRAIGSHADGCSIQQVITFDRGEPLPGPGCSHLYPAVNAGEYSKVGFRFMTVSGKRECSRHRQRDARKQEYDCLHRPLIHGGSPRLWLMIDLKL